MRRSIYQSQSHLSSCQVMVLCSPECRCAALTGTFTALEGFWNSCLHATQQLVCRGLERVLCFRSWDVSCVTWCDGVVLVFAMPFCISMQKSKQFCLSLAVNLQSIELKMWVAPMKNVPSSLLFWSFVALDPCSEFPTAWNQALFYKMTLHASTVQVSSEFRRAMVEWPASSPDLNPIKPVGSS